MAKAQLMRFGAVPQRPSKTEGKKSGHNSSKKSEKKKDGNIQFGIPANEKESKMESVTTGAEETDIVNMVTIVTTL